MKKMKRRQQRHQQAESKYALQWEKIKSERGLYRFKRSGVYFANFRRGGKHYRESLHTTDLPLARRKLHDLKSRIDRTDPRFGKISLLEWLKVYFETLKGAETTLADKWRIIERVKATWFLARSIPMRDLKRSQIATWLNEQFGAHGASSYNAALTLIRDAFAAAVHDRVLTDNPITDLSYRRRTKPIRPTPTFEQFQALIADIRAQRFNADALDSADFLELLGLAGLGQAEASSLTRADVDFEAGQMTCYRHKTSQGFVVPIFPQLRPLLERLCEGKKPHHKLFKLAQARKALANACRRLGFVRELATGELVPAYSHRSLRRCFITRAIQLGVDVKTISEWQGHKDGGQLILSTYSHGAKPHSQRMAQIIATEQPPNVIQLDDQSQQG
jgi:integrase